MMKRLTFSAATFLMSIFVLFSLPAGAKQSSSDIDAFRITVAPIKINLSAKPGRSQATAVRILNSGTEIAMIETSAVNFTKDEAGRTQLLPDRPNSPTSWIERPGKFKLAPGETRIVDITINVPQKAEPGTHYAMLLFSAHQPDGARTASGARMSSVLSVGSMLLINLPGKVVKSGSLTGFTGPGFLRRGPAKFATSVKNSGNVHLTVTGMINIISRSGKNISKIPVSSGELGITALPKSDISLESVWKEVPFWGVYRAQATVDLGLGKSETKELTLYILPYDILAASLALLALLFFGVRFLMRKLGIKIVREPVKNRSSQESH
jgi:hypothetical protein